MFSRIILAGLMVLANFENSKCQESDEEVTCEDGYFSYDVSTHDDVRFLLLTPDNQTIELNSTNLDLLNASRPIKILIHGLTSFEKSKWIDKVAYNYHTKGDYNVIAVDWSVIAENDTLFVVSAVDSVGNIVGEFILEVVQTSAEHLRRVHLIGSSVGAQVSGAAGKTVAKKGIGRIDRITALDPTEPENLEQLEENDAEFVDVIHTTVALGERNVGTVDFYVTGDNPKVPICPNATCEHPLGTEYFVRSMSDSYRIHGISCYNASAYIQRLCDVAKNATLGEYISRNVSGSFLVSGNATPGVHSQGKYLLGMTIILYLCII